MKLMFASDIHGSLYYAEKTIGAYKNEKADKLILLGDLLYHGPRNDLPKDYNPKGVIALLNSVKNEILAVRGNCEAEVDQMVLEFPVMAEYCILFEKGRMWFITHGHRFNVSNPPMLKKGDLLIHGHTHIQAVEEQPEGYVYINPGSVSIPKNGNKNSYMIYEEGKFYIKDLDGNIIKEYGL
ncbi:MAG: phosphodiesterase [Clostridia bacterium]|nr:phosphodiesterase [Clostridia bacterium]